MLLLLLHTIFIIWTLCLFSVQHAKVIAPWRLYTYEWTIRLKIKFFIAYQNCLLYVSYEMNLHKARMEHYKFCFWSLNGVNGDWNKTQLYPLPPPPPEYTINHPFPPLPQTRIIEYPMIRNSCLHYLPIKRRQWVLKLLTLDHFWQH